MDPETLALLHAVRDGLIVDRKRCLEILTRATEETKLRLQALSAISGHEERDGSCAGLRNEVPGIQERVQCAALLQSVAFWVFVPPMHLFNDEFSELPDCFLNRLSGGV